jgi:hypothetical protein
MQERENVLKLFKETKEAVSRGDSAKIKLLSDQTTNTASLTHDPDNIAAAVVIYSLGKIIERKNYQSISGWNKFYKIYLSEVENIISSLEREDYKSYRVSVENIQHAMNEVSSQLKLYVEDIFRKARINKASRIYDHGISMESTAKLLGVSLYELAEYSGQKDTGFVETKEVDVKDRVRVAMEMFE